MLPNLRFRYSYIVNHYGIDDKLQAKNCYNLCMKKTKKSLMRHIVILSLIAIIYLVRLFLISPQIFSYRFSESLIKKYFCSQDIPKEPPCKRLFLSDGDIHIASGYLYIKGADPTEYNFQHTPFIKYLYGFTILLTKNPFYLEILLGIVYLFLIYVLAFRIFGSFIVSALTVLAIIFDPLFIMLSKDASLELGQAVFLLAYMLTILYKKENYLIQGIFLGLFASSKFWGAVPFFVLMLNGFNLFKKRLKIKTFLLHLLVGFFVFSLTYLKTFINKHGLFNIIFFQLKLLKYWVNHSITNFPFASIGLFLTGLYKSWWDNNLIVKSDGWSFLWPIIFFITGYRSITFIKKKLFNNQFLIFLIPFAYLFYLGAQAPFLRYFILILPFFYMTFFEWIVDKFLSSTSYKTKRNI